MKQFVLFLSLALLVNIVAGRAVSKKKEDEQVEEHHEPNIQEDALEYERYLKEVVNALETDPEFRKKLDNATDVDIRSGKIANELEHVNHHVRSKLDEIKRREIERLRLAAIKHYELTNDIDRDHLKIADHRHVDHENPHTFEIEDLKKLIHKTSEDLAEADRKRRDEFKEYELQKEFEKQEKLREMDEQHKKQYEEELKRQQQKHNNHERIHHPGNKAQLEEVWEKQDHMSPEDFDPKTFFMMHDLDGNNFWDETEVKALFVKELDKVYQSGIPEDDMRERVEEMERMREHVFRETDTNHDNLISLEEFIAQTKREEFNRDPNWDTVDNQPQFTHEEYLEFERRRQEEIQRLIAQGALPPHPNMPQGYYPNQQQPPQYQYQGNYPQQVPVHPNQAYQHQGNPNVGQVNPNQAYPNAPIQQPIGQINHGQINQQGQIVNQGQIPPGQINTNQINTQYQQGNVQYQPPSNQNINNAAGQTGNQQQFKQPGNQQQFQQSGNQQAGNQQQQFQPPGNQQQFQQAGNQQQFQQPSNPNLNANAAAQNAANVLQNQANVQYQQPAKVPDSNLNQINGNAKIETKH